jgi:predicted SAM-dependent methyltransferase
MRLNVGCGKRRLPGYTGIDVVQRDGVDIVAPAHAIPLPDGCADEILGVHIWEHFLYWECDGVLAEWRRLLKPRGMLVLEMPDLIKCCRNILEGRESKKRDQMGMWGLFGDVTLKDVHMLHRWSWTFSTLSPFLAERGFTNIVERETQFHPAGRGVRDFRIEARKA